MSQNGCMQTARHCFRQVRNVDELTACLQKPNLVGIGLHHLSVRVTATLQCVSFLSDSCFHSRSFLRQLFKIFLLPLLLCLHRDGTMKICLVMANCLQFTPGHIIVIRSHLFDCSIVLPLRRLCLFKLFHERVENILQVLLYR